MLNGFSGPNPVWLAIQADAYVLAEDKDPSKLPLWPDYNPLSSDWEESQSILRNTPGGEFWIDWYQRALDGQPQNWPLLHDVALIDDALWEQGGEALDQAIGMILTRHNIERIIAENPHGYRAAVSKRTHKIHAIPAEEINLDEIVKALRTALRDFVRRCEKSAQPGSNRLDDEVLRVSLPAIEELRRKIKKCRTVSQALYDQIEASQTELLDALSGSGLQHEVLVNRLMSDLDRSKTDICVADQSVLKTLQQRQKVALAIYTHDRIALIIKLTRGMADDSERVLRLAALRSVEILNDPSASDTMRANALYFCKALLPAGARAVEMDPVMREKVNPLLWETGVRRAEELAKLDKGADVLSRRLPEIGHWTQAVYEMVAQSEWPSLFPS